MLHSQPPKTTTEGVKDISSALRDMGISGNPKQDWPVAKQPNVVSCKGPPFTGLTAVLPAELWPSARQGGSTYSARRSARTDGRPHHVPEPFNQNAPCSRLTLKTYPHVCIYIHPSRACCTMNSEPGREHFNAGVVEGCQVRWQR